MGPALLPFFLVLWPLFAPLTPAGVLDFGQLDFHRLLTSRPAFHVRTREVSNWRFEAAANLGTFFGAALPFIARHPATLPRCVKLNNYWCIKRAGWTGEIAADAEGHVAFASASDGARTAALLLHRYYVDFGRRSAMAIVSLWAPAQCGVPASAGFMTALATRGLANTLRGRWLAAHRRPSALVRLRRSVIPDHPLRLMRTPTIEAGVTELEPASAGLTTLSLLAPSAPAVPARPSPHASCPSEDQRIAHYASRAVEGIAGSVDADLKLFDADDRATPNLARLMANMAAVEVGPLHASPQLIASAIAEADAQRLAAKGRPLARR